MTPLVVLGLSVVVATAAGAQRPSERYDQHFRKYTKRYFGPGWDWRVFKAQALTESGLDSAATSRAGARGVMQLMPSTYGQIQSKNPELGAIEQPEWNIAAGISHARAMWRVWRGRVVPEDRRTFMFGSYNAGRSPIARAQDLAAASAFDPRLWASIEAVAPRVQGWRHQETLGYVRKIDVNLARLDPHGRLMRRR